MHLTRRNFLAASTLSGVGLALGANDSASAAATKPAARKKIKLGISSYSYWQIGRAHV